MNIEAVLDRVDFLYHKALKEYDWYTADTLNEVISILVKEINEGKKGD